MRMWENKVISLDAEAEEVRGSSYAGVDVDPKVLYEDVLDRYGAMGWEVAAVNASPHPKWPDYWVPTVWLKRPVGPGRDVPEDA